MKETSVWGKNHRESSLPMERLQEIPADLRRTPWDPHPEHREGSIQSGLKNKPTNHETPLGGRAPGPTQAGYTQKAEPIPLGCWPP